MQRERRRTRIGSEVTDKERERGNDVVWKAPRPMELNYRSHSSPESAFFALKGESPYFGLQSECEGAQSSCQALLIALPPQSCRCRN